MSLGEVVPADRVGVLWLLVAFIVTTAATRWVTRRIRARELTPPDPAATESDGEGKGGLIQNVHIGGVHIHHQVWGILLCLVTGLLLVTYHPGPGGALNVLGAMFGAGAALALDEFAMWLHLKDVYWSTEGRASITALMTAAAIALVLVLGANPLDLGSPDNEGFSAWVVAVFAVVNFALAVVCILKGKPLLALLGLFTSVLGLVGAVRLAKPGSWWARRRYPIGSRKDRRSEERFDADYARRWLRIKDAIGGSPHR